MRNGLLPQIWHLRKTTVLGRLNVDLLLFCSGLNLTVIARSLGRSSLSLVVENFQSLLTSGLLVFKVITIAYYISKVAGV